MKFSVTISSVSARQLPSKDSNGLSDPYVEFDFDSFKKVKTPVLNRNLNPIWQGWETSFEYETRHPELMDRKVLKVLVYDRDFLSTDDYMCGLEIDLWTLATGPARHDLPLFDADRQPAGRLHFHVRFEQLSEATVTFSCIQAVDLPLVNGVAPSTYLRIGYSNHHKAQCLEPPQHRDGNRNPEWLACGTMKVKGGLEEVMGTAIDVVVVRETKRGSQEKGDPVLVAVRLPVAKYFSLVDGQSVSFSEPYVAAPEFAAPNVKGLLQGTLEWAQFPRFAQMVAGTHTEAGIRGGQYKYVGMHQPKIASVEAQAAPALIAPASAQASDAFNVVFPAGAPHLQYGASAAASASSPSPVLAPRVMSPVLVPAYSSPSVEEHKQLPAAAAAAASANLQQQQQQQQQQRRQPIQRMKDPTLPAGWEYGVDPGTGRTFYVNVEQRFTTWERPNAVPEPAQPPPPAYTPLPEGWDEKVDPRTGRTYYRNLVTRSTQWERPV